MSLWYNNKNMILNEKNSCNLSLAVLPIKLIIPIKESSESVIPLIEGFYESAEFLFQKNEIILTNLEIFDKERKKKAVLNNSGFRVFIDLGKIQETKSLNLITLENDHYFGTSHKLDLELLDEDDSTTLPDDTSNTHPEMEGEEGISGFEFPKKVALLYLTNKQTVRNLISLQAKSRNEIQNTEGEQKKSRSAFVQSIVTFTSHKEKKTKLQIFVYKADFDQLSTLKNQRPLYSAEVYIRKLGSPTIGDPDIQQQIFSEHEPNSNMYNFSGLDAEMSGVEELPIHNLGTKRFIKFNDESDFELIVKYDGNESSFKLRIIEKTANMINCVLIGGKDNDA